MEQGGQMKIYYDDKYDLLYIRFSRQEKEKVQNIEIFDGVVLDVGENGKIVGIEILDASEKIALEELLPIKYAFNTGARLSEEVLQQSNKKIS